MAGVQRRTLTPAWDDRRNTSAVRPVPPNLLPEALEALRRWRAANPAHAAWLAAGAPTLTDAEHVERFGEAYSGTGRRRRR